ncbi:ricin-type beta-trefoil lectin domain protein [Streptomyces sp. NPDC127084]|uniref:ricin-type beta-trefoil lectin domain protein n=1 Tax=Streptomyces sp. NPDC127084 TaxID=3347133 RepID=UPI00365998D3
MSELHRAGPDAAYETRTHTGLTDAELTERVRAGAPAAQPAALELKRRHLPALLAYTRLCASSQTAANQLAVRAFDLAIQEALRGIEPGGTWRHHLLALVGRTGRDWAARSLRDRLEPGFLGWIEAGAEASSAMRVGFARLPEVLRGVLWYAVVDDEPDAIVGGFLGITADMVPELRPRAQDAMRRAWIQAHLERGGTPECLGFRRIIEAATGLGDRRYSRDLTLHLEQCPSCTGLVAALTRMADAPRTVCAEGLIGWGGAAYITHVPAPGLFDAVVAGHGGGAEPGDAAPLAGVRQESGPARLAGAVRTSSRSSAIAAAAAVAGVITVGTLLATASNDTAAVHTGAVEPPVRQAGPPAGASLLPPTPSPSVTPSKRPSPRPTASKSASPPRSSAPTTPTPSRTVTPGPSRIVPGGGRTQVVNGATGLCLDIEDGVLANRTDVVTAPCSGANTQQWSLEPSGLLRSAADPAFCLDSRGDTDRGVGIWTCDSVHGGNGVNLLFTIDASGVIHPRIATDFALEPETDKPGSELGFERTDDPDRTDRDQFWTGART